MRAEAMSFVTRGVVFGLLVCAWQSQVWFAWLCRLGGMSQRGGGQFRSPFWRFYLLLQFTLV